MATIAEAEAQAQQARQQLNAYQKEIGNIPQRVELTAQQRFGQTATGQARTAGAEAQLQQYKQAGQQSAIEYETELAAYEKQIAGAKGAQQAQQQEAEAYRYGYKRGMNVGGKDWFTARQIEESLKGAAREGFKAGLARETALTAQTQQNVQLKNLKDQGYTFEYSKTGEIIPIAPVTLPEGISVTKTGDVKVGTATYSGSAQVPGYTLTATQFVDYYKGAQRGIVMMPRTGVEASQAAAWNTAAAQPGTFQVFDDKVTAGIQGALGRPGYGGLPQTTYTGTALIPGTYLTATQFIAKYGVPGERVMVTGAQTVPGQRETTIGGLFKGTLEKEKQKYTEAFDKAKSDLAPIIKYVAPYAKAAYDFDIATKKAVVKDVTKAITFAAPYAKAAYDFDIATKKAVVKDVTKAITFAAPYAKAAYDFDIATKKAAVRDVSKVITFAAPYAKAAYDFDIAAKRNLAKSAVIAASATASVMLPASGKAKTPGQLFFGAATPPVKQVVTAATPYVTSAGKEVISALGKVKTPGRAFLGDITPYFKPLVPVVTETGKAVSSGFSNIGQIPKRFKEQGGFKPFTDALSSGLTSLPEVAGKFGKATGEVIATTGPLLEKWTKAATGTELSYPYKDPLTGEMTTRKFSEMAPVVGEAVGSYGQYAVPYYGMGMVAAPIVGDIFAGKSPIQIVKARPMEVAVLGTLGVAKAAQWITKPIPVVKTMRGPGNVLSTTTKGRGVEQIVVISKPERIVKTITSSEYKRIISGAGGLREVKLAQELGIAVQKLKPFIQQTGKFKVTYIQPTIYQTTRLNKLLGKAPTIAAGGAEYTGYLPVARITPEGQFKSGTGMLLFKEGQKTPYLIMMKGGRAPILSEKYSTLAARTRGIVKSPSDIKDTFRIAATKVGRVQVDAKKLSEIQRIKLVEELQHAGKAKKIIKGISLGPDVRGAVSIGDITYIPLKTKTKLAEELAISRKIGEISTANVKKEMWKGELFVKEVQPGKAIRASGKVSQVTSATEIVKPGKYPKPQSEVLTIYKETPKTSLAKTSKFEEVIKKAKERAKEKFIPSTSGKQAQVMEEANLGGQAGQSKYFGDIRYSFSDQAAGAMPGAITTTASPVSVASAAGGAGGLFIPVPRATMVAKDISAFVKGTTMMGGIGASALRTSQEGKQKVVPKSKLKMLNVLEIAQIPKTGITPISGSGVSSELKQEPFSVTLPSFAPPEQIVIQKPEQVIITTPRVTTPVTPDIIRRIDPVYGYRFKMMAPFQQEQAKKQMLKKKVLSPRAYLVATRFRKKKTLFSATPLSMGEALTFGARKTKATARASFELIPVKAAPRSMGLPTTTPEALIASGQFRAPKRGPVGMRFVQPSRKRIGTIGEVREISLVGAAARRGKKRSPKGFYF